MPSEREQNLPSYERPPVHEVGIGIGFRRLNCWTATAPGEFWALIRDKFPRSEDKPPLPPLLLASQAEFNIDLSELPPLRRVWYVSEDDSTLVQVQQDRIHVNWRKMAADAVYPRYGHVLDLFTFALAKIIQYAQEHGEILEPSAGEVTYVNQIPEGQLWSSWDDLGGVFKDWTIIPQNVGTANIVSSAVTFEGGQNGTRFVSAGRQLTVDVKAALRPEDMSKVLVLQLTSRGPNSSNKFEDISTWVDVASADIVKAFAALTSNRAQEFWGRKSEI